MTFREDLENGQATERALAKLLSEGIGVSPRLQAAVADAGSSHDLLIRCEAARVEVKDETAQAGTGNIAVETHQWAEQGVSGKLKPSGILTSAASVWVHVFWDGGLGSVDRLVAYSSVEMYRRILVGLEEGIATVGPFTKKVAFRKADNGNCGLLVDVEMARQAWPSWFFEVPSVEDLATLPLWPWEAVR